MSESSWNLVFDVSALRNHSDGLLMAVVGVVVGVASITWYRTTRSERDGALAVGLAIFSLVSAVVGCAVYSRDRNELSLADSCHVAEGLVHILREEPVGGRPKWEVLEVGGQRARASRSIEGIGHARTVATGSVLQEGALARVCIAADRRIMRIWLPRLAQGGDTSR